VTPEEVRQLRDSYDAQLRAHVHDRLPGSVTVERDGPLVRTVGFGTHGFVEYHDLGGLDGDELDALIARQVEVFAERRETFEWKLHGHDLPDDLPDHLRAGGLAPEETETVVIARVDDVAAEPELPEGVVIREVRARGDFARIAELEEAVWHKDHSWLDALADEREADPDSLRVFVAEADDRVVCAAWARFPSATEFVTYWGGATLAEWRGRGIYRALVAHRARLAAERGRRYIEVDASDDSRPILERLGFVPVTTTTPWVWRPPVADSGESG
jgi:GNAT superfamily N-acetyltransferase